MYEIGLGFFKKLFVQNDQNENRNCMVYMTIDRGLTASAHKQEKSYWRQLIVLFALRTRQIHFCGYHVPMIILKNESVFVILF